LAEEVVLRALDEEHQRGRAFTVISEEVGERSYGEGGDVIVVDPIDGSHNAKMGIPYFSLVLAAARGRDFGSVYEATVRNLVTGETLAARRGGGATRNGVRLDAGPGLVDGRLNVLQVEGTAWAKNSWRYDRLIADAQKVRILGSAALNICLCASGALSLSVAPSLRSVDCVGPLLVLEEAGGVAADFEGASLVAASLDLTTRVPVVAAASRSALDRGLELMNRDPETSPVV
jgi:myo-inositol-1(or 4)-monophosphatase